MKKINRSHPIPKRQQILQTPANHIYMVFSFLEGKPFNDITVGLGGLTKRQWRENGVDIREIKVMEGRAVERKVYRLFKGKVKQRGKFVKQLPLFDRLPFVRTGPLGRNEIRCFKIAIKWKRSIGIISRLTGRSEDDVKRIINLPRFSNRKKKTLFGKGFGNAYQ